MRIVLQELNIYSEDYFNDDGVPLIEMEKRLRNNLEYLHSLVRERQNQLNQLMRQEQVSFIWKLF